jgi:methyltransferase (TIGR00027 family)
MQEGEALLKDISDTALWVTAYRARETRRDDALFRDLFAERLAGRRGAELAERLLPGHKQEWSFVTRTVLFDQLIRSEVAAGVDAVVCLAAGLDARPYRMDLPDSLRWIEVDLPALLTYKEAVLESDEPRCSVERIALDLTNREERRALFARLAAETERAMVVTEGLVIYLPRTEVAHLAEDLAAHASFRSWAVDVVSPGLMRMMARQSGEQLERAGAPFQFAPEEGPEFYVSHGWKPAEVHSVFKTARRLRRLPFALSVLAMRPEPKKPKPNAIWSGVCLMHRA